MPSQLTPEMMNQMRMQLMMRMYGQNLTALPGMQSQGWRSRSGGNPWMRGMWNRHQDPAVPAGTPSVATGPGPQGDEWGPKAYRAFRGTPIQMPSTPWVSSETPVVTGPGPQGDEWGPQAYRAFKGTPIQMPVTPWVSSETPVVTSGQGAWNPKTYRAFKGYPA